VYTNADSVINKIDELKGRINLFSPDINYITDIFPKNCLYGISMVGLHIEGYDCFSFQFNHHNGGVCIYIRTSLNAQKLNCSCNIQCRECIFCSLSLLHSDNIIVGLVYRSPNSNESNDSNLWDLFKEIIDVFGNSCLLIIGDFNLYTWTAPNWDS